MLHKNQSHQSELREHTDCERIPPTATVSSLSFQFLRIADPCLQSEVVQLSGTWDKLMSLWCNQWLLFEAWHTLMFNVFWMDLQNIFMFCCLMCSYPTYKNMVVSIVVQKLLIEGQIFKSEQLHDVWICVKTCLCTAVDFLGTYAQMWRVMWCLDNEMSLQWDVLEYVLSSHSRVVGLRMWDILMFQNLITLWFRMSGFIQF